MYRSRRDKIFTEINRLLMENELSADDRESMLHSLLRYYLDSMEDIEEIDTLQDRVNEIIDEYVEQHFEDSMEDNYN